MARTKEERIQREIAKLEREKAKPKGPYYLIYFILIVSIVFIADELATQVGYQMQNIIASDFFAPLVGEEFAVARISLVNTIAGFTVGVVFLYRTLSDRFGRKVFLVINAFGIGLGLFLISIATNIPVYTLGVVMMQFFLPNDMHQVYIQECAPPRHRAKMTSIIAAIATLSMLAIPLMRDHFLRGNNMSGWRSIYLILAVFSMVASLFALFFVRESDAFVESRLRTLRMTEEEKKAAKESKSKQENGVGLIAAVKFCFTHKQIRWLFIAGGFVSFGMLVTQYYETIMTFGYARQFLDAGMPLESARVEATSFVTQALMLFSIGSALINLVSGFTADRFGRRFNMIAMCDTSLATFLLFYIGSNLSWNPHLVGLCCGISVYSYWCAGGMVGLMCNESTPTNIRVSVGAVQPIVNGIIFMLASTSVTTLGNILGDAAIGTICLLVSAPGMALGLLLMMLKVKETKNVGELGGIRGDEFEK